MSFLVDNYARYNLSLVRGAGCRVWDTNGDEYLDFTSGISVTSLGHSNEVISDVICSQSKTLLHTSNLFHNPYQEELAQRLSHLFGGGKSFFCNSGAEAGEAAIKLARIIGNKRFEGKKHRIVTMNNSFHGRTFATMSATGQSKIHKGFEPLADFFTHVDYEDIVAVENELSKGDVVAVMLELIQGEGGVVPASAGYISELFALTRETDTLLIVDEIQTGIGRTGKVFCFEHYGIQPDIITVAKALGNGLPIGAMIARDEFAEYLTAGTHGSTFGGGYIPCRVGIEVLKQICAHNFLEEVTDRGDYATSRLKKLKGTIEDVVGLGLMIGIKLSCDVNEFILTAQKEGLLLVPAGNNTVRFYPPLNVTYGELDEGLEIISRVVSGG